MRGREQVLKVVNCELDFQEMLEPSGRSPLDICNEWFRRIKLKEIEESVNSFLSKLSAAVDFD